MNSTIHTVDDLLAEKKRLANHIKYRKASISTSFDEIKDEINPFKNISGTAKTLLKSKTKIPFINQGIGAATQFLFRKIILRRAGWLPRLIFPYILKKVSAHVIGSKVNEKVVSGMHQVADSIREDEDKLSNVEYILHTPERIGNKIGDSLHDVADKVRDMHIPKPVPEHIEILKPETSHKISSKLRNVADTIRPVQYEVLDKQKDFNLLPKFPNKKMAYALRQFADNLRTKDI